MQIVVNTASLLSPLTGIGQYTYQICKKLKEMDRANAYTYYYGFFSDELYHRVETKDGAAAQNASQHRKFDAFQNVKNFIKKIPVVGPAGRQIRTSINQAVQFVKRKKFDLYFEPNFIPLREIRAQSVVTMVFDLSVLLYPQWHPQERIDIFKRYFHKGVKRSDVILTSTQFIKSQIVEHLQVEPSRIAVTPISCNKDAFRTREERADAEFLKSMNVPRDFVLFVGSIEPRKNILGLLKAFTVLPKSVKEELHIVFCGPSGWKNSDVFQFIEQYGLKERILFLSYVTDEQLSILYNHAVALVYPSFYEGFGLPPLEAMSSGCPAIVSDIPPHREVCGEAAFYVRPESPEEIARAVEKLFTDPELRALHRKQGLAQSQKFSWENAARQTLDIFLSFSLNENRV